VVRAPLVRLMGLVDVLQDDTFTDLDRDEILMEITAPPGNWTASSATSPAKPTRSSNPTKRYPNPDQERNEPPWKCL
jgi:hypothetical protein